MKRDFGEIRRLLLLIEESDDPSGKAFFWKEPKILMQWGLKTDPFPEAEELTQFVDYQLNKMEEGRLIDRKISPGGYAPNYVQMTFEGHDYLDAIRDTGIWNKTREIVQVSGGNVTIEVIKKLAVGLLKKKISQHTDIDL